MRTRTACAIVVTGLVFVGTAFGQPAPKFEKIYRAGKALAAGGENSAALEVLDVSKAKGGLERVSTALDAFNLERAIVDDLPKLTFDELSAKSAYQVASIKYSMVVLHLKKKIEMLEAAQDPRRHYPDLPAALRAPEWKDVIAYSVQIQKEIDEAAGSLKDAETKLLAKPAPAAAAKKKPAAGTKKAPAKPPATTRTESSTATAPARVGEGSVAAPTRVKYVPPVYPELAQSARVQGAVIVEAVIGPDGRVQDAKIVRSIALLDQAALDAVRQWEYAPTVIGGVAVPVIMTVTVNFTLQRP